METIHEVWVGTGFESPTPAYLIGAGVGVFFAAALILALKIGL